ncbi:hypothetical protein [Streptomyces sp. NPDC048192]|jgi:hypothetical protein|uniref:hypothetical protein n=1 Tax=unclassified Streptomyces TaxID=2593676 RepID=UPI003723D8C6
MAHGTDITTALTRPQRETERILTETLRLPTGDPRRRTCLKRAALALACDMAVADRRLHSTVRRYVPGGDRLVRQQATDLVRAEETMKDLEYTDTGSGPFEPLVRHLITTVHRHGEQFETAVLPRLRSAAPPEALARLADAVHEVEAEAAALRDEVEHSPRPDVIDRLQAALAPEGARTSAFRQAEQLDRFLTGEAEHTDL